jgi:hypothetical protein
MLRTAPGLLRVHHPLLQERLLLLRVLQQHARLLRHVLIEDATGFRIGQFDKAVRID